MTIESYLPPNCVKDGSVDYTEEVQRAVSANRVIEFPAFNILVNEKGINIPSDRDINFLLGGKLILKPTANNNYNVFRLQKVNNVIIKNAVIYGDKEKHIGTAGEWGHGIAMYGCSNITINNATITKCWGDGIYAGSKDGLPNSNIVINNAKCYHNRRNQISITSVIGLIINSPYCAFTSGVLPMCGIDLEPNYPTDEMRGVVITNPVTDSNGTYGISIGLSELFGGADKLIDIKIINWTDSNSKAALRASANRGGRVGTGRILGSIDIINPKWKDNSIAPWQVDIRTTDIKLNIVSPVLSATVSDLDALALFTKKENVNANYNLSF